jgi:hypothetical protein
VGDPTLVDPNPVSATDVQRQTLSAAMGPASGGSKSVGVEIITPGAAAEAEPAPGTVAGSSPFGPAAGTPGTPPPADPNELKPNTPADPNELKPTDNAGDQSLPPPPQVNEIAPGQTSSSAATASANSEPASDQEISSSKKKKKKGLKKVVPF